jgi:hypothetical protein
MKDIKLAESMIDNLDWFKKHPDWEDTYNEFKPMIELLMKKDNCNSLKAVAPILRQFKESNDPFPAQMALAVATEMALETKIQ